MKKITPYLISLITLVGLLVAGGFHFLGKDSLEDEIFTATIVIGTIPLIYRMVKDFLHGRYGVDIIAAAAIITSLILHQYLAGTVILLMLSGGEALEAYALRRARRELSALISNAPTTAHIKQDNGLIDIPAGQVKLNDIILIKPGEAVPVDGLVISGVSMLDESALTGESLPKEKRPGSLVLSGSINSTNPLEIRTLKIASDSKYEQIIRLVKEAEESRAPVVRLADRYSVWFSLITFILAALAWFTSHEPLRLLAVLVVATPCPLILATPIAIISGISRAASRGIIVKNGGALETLAEVNAFIFDKTGTLTLGQPKVVGVKIFNPNFTEASILNLAASLDQVSAHILARSLLAHAHATKDFQAIYPENFKENFGEGVSGNLSGKLYHFGKLQFLRGSGIKIDSLAEDAHKKIQDQGKIAVYLAADNELVGAIYFADVIRSEIKALFVNFKKQGLDKLVMLTGDKKNVADVIAKELGLDDIHAEALPEDKVKEVKEHQREFGKVAMVGDGVNDAPALAAADVGIALGGHGQSAGSNSGDIVITVDNLERVGEAYIIAKRVLKIAKQGIFIGIGASIVLMIFASFGYIQPVYGALLQELLDVIVILNALRVNFQKV